MRIFALSDPHLSTVSEKPMDVFGDRWENHTQHIKENWLKCVKADDIVIMPGDISWGLKFDEVYPDLEWIHNLPGTKIISKGNHDLWWTSLSKLNSLFDDIIFLQNNYYDAGGIAICGTRGWTIPIVATDWSDHDEKIYKRELIRLRTALEAAKKDGYERIIVALHYPPTDSKGRRSEITDIIEEYKVQQVIYGHLHGEDAQRNAYNGIRNGIKYMLVSSDSLNFIPKLIYDNAEDEE